MERLAVQPISRVQATQRAGRAGRTQPGKCYRLFTQEYYNSEMPNTTAPEIQRTSLLGTVLHLKSLPMDVDVLSFDFVDPPARVSLEEALRQLYILDALDLGALSYFCNIGNQALMKPSDQNTHCLKRQEHSQLQQAKQEQNSIVKHISRSGHAFLMIRCISSRC